MRGTLHTQRRKGEMLKRERIIQEEQEVQEGNYKYCDALTLRNQKTSLLVGESVKREAIYAKKKNLNLNVGGHGH
jgi:hypothetical protein